jgi:hypothetical protein
VAAGSGQRSPSSQAPGLADHVILLCGEGYRSSLAAATLRQLGFTHATDVDGGFQAWQQAGLPVNPPGQLPVVVREDYSFAMGGTFSVNSSSRLGVQASGSA